MVRTPPATGNQPPGEVDTTQTGVLAGAATVLSVSAPDGSDTTRVSLIVPLDAAGALYRANATGQLALIVLPAA